MRGKTCHDWLSKWRAFSKPITERSIAMPKQLWVTFDPQNENCSVVIKLESNRCLILFQQAEEIRTSAATYVTEITELLNRVPRQLLLLLKTNDLLRSIDYRLNTSDTSRSFITMSRCCIRALTKQRLKTCDGWRDWFRIQTDSTMSHLRITLYQMYVSGVFLSLRRLFTSLMGALTFLWYRVTGVRLCRLSLGNVNLLTELNTFVHIFSYNICELARDLQQVFYSQTYTWEFKPCEHNYSPRIYPRKFLTRYKYLHGLNI